MKKNFLKLQLNLILFIIILVSLFSIVNVETNIIIDNNASGINMIKSNFGTQVFVRSNGDNAELFVNLVKPKTMDNYELSVNNKKLKTIKTDINTEKIAGKIFVSIIKTEDLDKTFTATMYVHVMKREVKFNFTLDLLLPLTDASLNELFTNFAIITPHSYDFYNKNKKLSNQTINQKNHH